MKAGAERLSGLLREQRDEMVARVAWVMERNFFFNGKKRKESLNGTWNFEYLKFAASA